MSRIFASFGIAKGFASVLSPYDSSLHFVVT
jgi:hypothetical protein